MRKLSMVSIVALACAACAAPVPAPGPAPAPPREGTIADPAVVDDSRFQGVIVEPTERVDDRRITDVGSLVSKRNQLVRFLWGPAGFPSGLPKVALDIESPVPGLSNVRRVDELLIEMDGGESNIAVHFVAERSNRRLVIVALGHSCSFADADLDDPTSDSGGGHFRTIDALLKDGYSVLATYMPHMRPGLCADINHNQLLAKPVTSGHAMKWFLEPTAVALNYLQAKSAADDFPVYRDFSMVGLSGGGWTTTVYAAIDTRVRMSFPIAGTVPLHLRSGASIGDGEQTLPAFYSIAGYPDLYLLGVTGAGDRRQVQVLNRRDTCCFGDRPNQYDTLKHGPWDLAMRSVESQVDASAIALGASGGVFRLEIDEAADHHAISWSTVVGTLLAELNGGPRRVAVDGEGAAASVFVRARGELWQHDESGWTSTGLPMVGTAATASSAAWGTQIFFRSPSNALMRGFFEEGAWKQEALGHTVVGDPAAMISSNDTITVVAVGRDYAPIVVTLAPDGAVESRVATESPRMIGVPALLDADDGHMLFLRGLDRGLHLFSGGASGPYAHSPLGGAMLHSPDAIRTSDGAVHAYITDPDTYALAEISRGADGEWSWSDVNAGAGGRPLTGTPTVSVGPDDVLRIHCRTQLGALNAFAFDGEWSRESIRARADSSPLSIGDRVFGTSRGRTLWVVEGDRTKLLGSPP
ncbi:MAG: hypothetical protein KF819_27700 [Labilithrix sp.]|nr:hypothetical protein [Labilithrix sp.]